MPNHVTDESAPTIISVEIEEVQLGTFYNVRATSSDGAIYLSQFIGADAKREAAKYAASEKLRERVAKRDVF